MALLDCEKQKTMDVLNNTASKEDGYKTLLSFAGLYLIAKQDKYMAGFEKAIKEEKEYYRGLSFLFMEAKSENAKPLLLCLKKKGNKKYEKLWDNLLK